jgi:hypothetical protein
MVIIDLLFVNPLQQVLLKSLNWWIMINNSLLFQYSVEREPEKGVGYNLF